MKAAALALAILLIGPGCSAQADAPARSEEAQRLAAVLPQRPAGPVLDQADVLAANEEALLDARLRDYWKRTRTAVVVATVDSLGGEPIERFSRALAETWDIGDPDNHRALLVLVAPNQRQVRIEVSCGLENVVTDAFAGQVIREQMVPQFRKGALDDGTLAGVDALIERLDADANPAPDACGSNSRKAA